MARFLPMVAGSLVEQYVTCGKPRCRCRRGQKHGPLYYFYWKEQGRSRSMYVPREQVGELRRQIQNYRRFQTELTALLRRQLRECQRTIQEGRRHSRIKNLRKSASVIHTIYRVSPFRRPDAL